MDGDTLMSAAVAIATAAGGWSIGKRTASNSAMQIASETVDMLQVQIESLREEKTSRDAEIDDLRNRVSVLESMVTQRAEVQAVHEEVKDARMVLDRIAVKVGA